MRHLRSKTRSWVWLGCTGVVVFCTPVVFAQDESVEAEAVQPSTAELIRMLHDDDAAVRAMGVRGLSESGDFDCLDELSKRLADDDSEIRDLTEQAMWQVWFRSGDENADALLQESIKSIKEHRFDEAIKSLDAALEIDPDFAEAYNQRAILHYFRRKFMKSIKDCQEVIKRNPYHFGALSGMGQCYQRLNNTGEAIKAYERALRVNPNMEGVRRGLLRLLRADGKAIQA